MNERWHLPVRLTDEFLDKQEWRKTGHFDVELCELGLLRRAQYSRYGGSVTYPPPNKLYPPRFRISVPGEKKRILVNVEDLMKKVFGAMNNHRIFDYDYLCKLRVLCMEFNRRSSQKESDTKGPARIEVQGKKRRCAGVPGKKCDAMILNYRCPACWVIIRGGQVLEEDPPNY